MALSERGWGIISALAGVFALIATIAIFFYSEVRSTKQLEVVLISKTSLVNPAAGTARKRLEIRYGDQTVPDITLFQLLFRNTGRQPILKADFEEPIIVQISNIDQIISAEKLAAIPTALSPKVTLKDKTTLIEGMLLNPDDQFTIEIIAIPTVGADSTIAPPIARIAGIKAIKYTPIPEALGSQSHLNSIFRVIIGVIATIVGALIASAVRWFSRGEKFLEWL
jgi:hypothetical protein